MQQAIETLACNSPIERSPACLRHCIARLKRPFAALACNGRISTEHRLALPHSRLKQTLDLSQSAPWIATNHSSKRFTRPVESWHVTRHRDPALGTWHLASTSSLSGLARHVTAQYRTTTGLLPDYYRTTTGSLRDYYGIATGNGKLAAMPNR